MNFFRVWPNPSIFIINGLLINLDQQLCNALQFFNAYLSLSFFVLMESGICAKEVSNSHSKGWDSKHTCSGFSILHSGFSILLGFSSLDNLHVLHFHLPNSLLLDHGFRHKLQNQAMWSRSKFYSCTTLSTIGEALSSHELVLILLSFFKR